MDVGFPLSRRLLPYDPPVREGAYHRSSAGRRSRRDFQLFSREAGRLAVHPVSCGSAVPPVPERARNPRKRRSSLTVAQPVAPRFLRSAPKNVSASYPLWARQRSCCWRSSPLPDDRRARRGGIREATLAAPMPARADERAAACIRTQTTRLTSSRDMSGALDGSRTARAFPACARPPFAARVRLDELRERAIEDRRDVTARDRVPQEVLRHLQLVARRGARGESNLVAFSRQRLHSRPRRRSGRTDQTASGAVRTRADAAADATMAVAERSQSAPAPSTAAWGRLGSVLRPLRDLPDRRRGVRLREAVSDHSSTSRLLRRDAAASSSRWLSAGR